VWLVFGVSVVSFGLGIVLAWIALTNNSSEMGWAGAGLMIAGLVGGWWPAWRHYPILTGSEFESLEGCVHFHHFLHV
jgi:hypothetical protein